MRLTFRSLTGAGVDGVLDDVAALRIAVFRDWPYLYDGDRAYERRYLDVYRLTRDAIVVSAHDGERLVGAATGLPLRDADGEFRAAFERIGADIAGVFYCAESVLLPEYRGQGAGHRFFDLREAHARAQGYGQVVFCGVVRPDDHPARPSAYRPLDAFWRKRGYAPLPGVTTEYSWKDIGARSETRKPLQFWSRML